MSQLTKQPVPASVPENEEDKGSTMSRGYVGGRPVPITAVQWLSSVNVGKRRNSSDGPRSGDNSGNTSRYASRSRPPSVHVMDPTFPPVFDVRGRSGKSGSRDRDEGQDNTAQTLKDE